MGHEVSYKKSVYSKIYISALLEKCKNFDQSIFSLVSKARFIYRGIIRQTVNIYRNKALKSAMISCKISQQTHKWALLRTHLNQSGNSAIYRVFRSNFVIESDSQSKWYLSTADFFFKENRIDGNMGFFKISNYITGESFLEKL